MCGWPIWPLPIPSFCEGIFIGKTGGGGNRIKDHTNLKTVQTNDPQIRDRLIIEMFLHLNDMHFKGVIII